MKSNIRMKAAAAAIAVAGALGLAHEAAAQANEIFVPVLVYRTGAYAPNGIPWADGFVDYLKLVNERDGGVNGIKLAFEECETGYATDRGVECYERLKSKKPVAVNPLSTGITFALTEKVAADKITLMTTGYGRSESADGSVFAWNFPLLGTYWSAADMIVPWGRFPQMLRACQELFAARDLDYAIWGHISDGNVHPNVLPRRAGDVETGAEAILELGRAVIAMGGCPLAEHGVGRHPLKKALLRLLHGEPGVAAMRVVKDSIDPAGRMAPGVIF